jgi:O-antigen ligase
MERLSKAMNGIVLLGLFLLIVVPVAAFLANRHGLTYSKPTVIYGVLAGTLLGTALSRGASGKRLSKAFQLATFGSFAVIVLLSFSMYRGEGAGPDIQPLLPVGIPTNISYAIWPTLNLTACLGLYLLGRSPDLRSIIRGAALIAFSVLLASIVWDLIWPAYFGDTYGRAGGIAQNSNNAALVIVFLACILLGYGREGLSVLMAMIVAVALTQSRSGMLAAVAVAAIYLWSQRGAWRVVVTRRFAAAAGAALLALTALAYLSPTLNPSEQELASRDALRAKLDRAHAGAGEAPTSDYELPMTLKERFSRRLSFDDSMRERSEVLHRYVEVIRARPFGTATGYTNKFRTGPHNTILKLAVDLGIPAALCLILLLLTITWWGFRLSTPLLCTAATAWVAALSTHTFHVDPAGWIAIGVLTGLTQGYSSLGDNRVVGGT